MTLRELQKEVTDLANVPMSDSQFIRNYNRCIFDLATRYDTAKASSNETIVCEDTKQEYPLNDSGTSILLKIERVLNSDGCYYRHFKIRNNSHILFSYKGTYTVYELLAPEEASTMVDAVSINLAYVKAIARYIASKALKRIDPEQSKEYMEDYEIYASQINRSIRGVDNPNKAVALKRWR